MKKYDCVIIDSGMNCKHLQYINKEIDGMRFDFADSGEIVIDTTCQDSIGHGTAVYSIIERNSPNGTTILNINIFGEEKVVDERLLLAALDYIDKNVLCKVINMSLGVKMCDNQQALYNICHILTKKGIIILAAFDNDGAISYPAAFDCVLGIDFSDDCTQICDYEYVEGNIVNIRAKGGFQKVPWLEPQYAIVKGSSFACAYMTANVLGMLLNDSDMTAENMHKVLRKHAKRIHSLPQKCIEEMSEYFVPNRVMIFPFNKEMHSLIAFHSLLSFEVNIISDVRTSGLVSRKLKELIAYRNLGEMQDKVIENFDRVEWNALFDTVLLGHCEYLSKLNKRDFIREILQLCIQYHKNLICLDDLTLYTEECEQLIKIGCRIYTPKLNADNIPKNQFGKLCLINKPIVCVAGTSSSQGKFTLQLWLRESFLHLGYRVGQLGTEPTSHIYGMDEVFHYGYGVENDMYFEQTILYVNELMKKIADKMPDIIFTGVQAGTVPYTYDNISYLTHRQLEVMTGIMPDAVVLCVNSQDDINYIQRTIATIESFLQASVLCCVLNPIRYSENFQVYSKKEYISDNEQVSIAMEFEKQLSIPVFVLGEYGVSEISKIIVEYFSE